MKKLLVAFSFLPLLTVAQTIYTVSNVPGASSNYKTLQGAHDSVVAGSILYILPSSFSYGNLVLTKKLTIYGTGFFLGQNLEPNTQANTASVIANSIMFRAGSDFSYVEGLQLTDNNGGQAAHRFVLDTVSNITISRCLITTNGAPGSDFFEPNGANNCVIRNCYLNTLDCGWAHNVIYGSNFSGIQFNNNIFYGGACGTGGGFTTTVSGTHDAIFTNNTIICSLPTSYFGNLNFTNNIFVDLYLAGVVSQSAIQLGGTNLFNITNRPDMFATPGNNQEGTNTDSMFVSGLAGYHSTDQKWTLRDTSFAQTFGQGGIQCGAYGGTDPYKLSGIPNLPYIYNLLVPAQATTPGTISIHIKAKASN